MGRQKAKAIKNASQRGADGLTKFQRYSTSQHHSELTKTSGGCQRKLRSRRSEKVSIIGGATARLQASSTAIDVSGNLRESTRLVDVFVPPKFSQSLTLQWLRDDTPSNMVPRRWTALKKFHHFSGATSSWASAWGGVLNWPIEFSRIRALSIQEEQLDEWNQAVLRHAQVGRHLLGQLTELSGALLVERNDKQEIWRVCVDCIEILVMGITTIGMSVSSVGIVAHDDDRASDKESDAGSESSVRSVEV